MVRLPEKDIPVREFYIEERKKSGKTVGELTQICGIQHPRLQLLEKNGKGKLSNSLVATLAGLEALGYEIILRKPHA